MQSFKRRGQISVTQPSGTRSSPSASTISILSTGIPSLDDVLGGGLPLGSVLVVLAPDPNTTYGDLVQRHFVAQGIASAQSVCILDDSAIKIASSCMWMPSTGASLQSSQEVEEAMPENGGLGVKIAWRYESMKKFQTSVDYTGSVSCFHVAKIVSQSLSRSQGDPYCHPLDLTCHLPEEVMNAAVALKRLRCLPVIPLVHMNGMESAMSQLDDVLSDMEQTTR